jgi:hypothetical protein
MILSQPVGAVGSGANGGIASPSTFMSPTAPIGGTSGGGPGAGSNVLSMNLGGVNVNYDMGPTTGELTNQAYNFLGNSFNADSALVGNTIVGSQNFLSGFANPVLNMAATQEDFNTQVLPTMFGTLSAQNYSLGSQAVQAESQTAQASIASSTASAKAASSGGGCYVTTAVCEARGEPDDGPTLTTLRKFRDGYMQESEARKTLVGLYYKSAPSLVAKIKARADAKDFLDFLYVRYIAPACEAIERGDNKRAFDLYSAALYRVEQEA